MKLNNRAEYHIIVENSGERITSLVQSQVSRVGSAGYCEIIVPGLPMHALTIIRNPDGLVVVKRVAEPMFIENEPLNTGCRVLWKSKSRLRIGKVQLVNELLRPAGVVRSSATRAAATVSMATGRVLESKKPVVNIPSAKSATADAAPEQRSGNGRPRRILIGFGLILALLLLDSETAEPNSTTSDQLLQLSARLNERIERQQTVTAGRTCVESLSCLLSRCLLASADGAEGSYPELIDTLCFCSSVVYSRHESISPEDQQIARDIMAALAEDL